MRPRWSAPPGSSGCSTRGCAIRRGSTSRCGSRSTSRRRPRSRTCWPQGMQEMRAKGAVGILMEADTGQIRALASLPDFDPNAAPAAADQGRSGRQPAVQPGGAGALRARLGVQALHRRATALEAGLVSPQTLVDIEVADALRAASPSATSTTTAPRLTVEDVLVKSSNIGAAHIGMMLGAAAAAGVLQEGSGFSTPRRSSSPRRRGPRRCCRSAGPTSRRSPSPTATAWR